MFVLSVGGVLKCCFPPAVPEFEYGHLSCTGCNPAPASKCCWMAKKNQLHHLVHFHLDSRNKLMRVWRSRFTVTS